MVDFSFALHNYIKLIAVIATPIIGIIFWKKQRTWESVVFMLGILLITLGELIRIFTNLAITLIHVINNTEMELPFIYYLGFVIESIGIIVAVFGFALVTRKMKRNI